MIHLNSEIIIVKEKTEKLTINAFTLSSRLDTRKTQNAIVQKKAIAQCQPSPDRAFQVNFAKARDDLLSELKKLRATKIVISCNIPTRQDGLPYAKFKKPEDSGVAV